MGAPLRFCVVGAGPAGFYAAERLRRAFPRGEVDLLERLPAPFGLVRAGVAPDHPGTKSVQNQFAETARAPGVRFWGNVELGRDVSLAELRAAFSGVVLACGAEGDRRLGIPGEAGPGVVSARAFSQWYNGHPGGWPGARDGGGGGGLRDLTGGVGLADARDVVVVGQGNVALDCARLLLRDPADLAATDIAAGALAELRASSVRRVRIVGRRGPAQAALAPKELREILALPGIRVSLDPETLALDACDEAAIGRVRRQKRVVEVLRKAGAGAATGGGDGGRGLRFDFLRRPVEYGNGRLRLEAMRLESPAALEARLGAVRRVEGTGELSEVPAELVIRAVGWEAQPVPGAPFDPERAVVPSSSGRVAAAGDGGAGALYVTGWLKRGPQGIIGTNLECAEETVASVSADARAGLLPPGGQEERRGLSASPLESLLSARGARPVSWAEWERLDAEEAARGAAAGKPREKFVRPADMLGFLDGGGG